MFLLTAANKQQDCSLVKAKAKRTIGLCIIVNRKVLYQPWLALRSKLLKKYL